MNQKTLEYITALTQEFEQNSDARTASKQEAYLRNQFKCFGLTTGKRREVQKPFLVIAFLPEKQELEGIVKQLWNKPQREFHYFAQEFVFRYSKSMEENDIVLFEYMILHQSWWDTVDFIANKLVGQYFKIYPAKKREYVEKWVNSNHIWLQRTALLFQLKYKEQLDTELLNFCIQYLLGSKEFFINKAIGWVLREYSRTNPDWVLDFVADTKLPDLSSKEALRLLQ